MADNFKTINDLDISFKEFMPGQIIQSAQFNDDMRDIEEKVNEVIGQHNGVANTVVDHLNNKSNPHEVTAHQVGTYTTTEIDEFIEDVKHGHLYDRSITNSVLADWSVDNRTIKDRTITASKVDDGFGNQIDISENIEITDRYTKNEVDELVRSKVGEGAYTKEEIDQKFEEFQSGQIIDKTISADKVTSDFGDNIDISNNTSITNRYTKGEVDMLISKNGLPRDWGNITEQVDVDTGTGSLPVAGHMVAGQFTTPATPILDIDVKENVEARGEYSSVGKRLNGVDLQVKDIETRIDNIGGSNSGNVDLSGYVTKEIGNANQITFSDGQTFQEKLNNGELRGSQGIQGEQGQKGVDGITPSISIGNVRTLEPTQQATVTKRGTDANPIFDFGIPKGVKGDKGEDGVGGATESSSNLIAKYVHEGNKEIHPISLDLSTGVYTCDTPHGISSPTEVLVIPKENGGLRKIPSELFDTRKNYRVVPIDDKTFRITKEGAELTYSEENNTDVDATKFYFDCFVQRILQIQLEKPCKEVEVLVSGITGSGDCYMSPYYEGFDKSNLQSFSGTCYQGVPALSPNAYHGTPRFFSIKADFSILNSMLISKGINAQYGFTGRTVKNAVVNVNTFSDFARNNFDKLRLGSAMHTWGLTNGLTVLIYNKGGNTI